MAIVNLAAIFAKARRLTGTNLTQIPDFPLSNDPNSVGLADYLNSFYNYDFPAQFRSLKLKDIYTFNTTALIDTYPFNSEQYTTVEMPCYCMKREIKLFNDPWNFYGSNFNWQSQSNFSFGNGTNGPYSGFTNGQPILRSYNNNPGSPSVTGVITAITQAANAQVTSSAPHGLLTGAVVAINGVVGMIQVNGYSYTITVNSTTTFLLNVNSTAYTAYSSGGTWTSFTAPLNYGTPNVPGISQGRPAYAAGRVQNILITANTATGTDNVSDDGYGNLIGDVSTVQPAGQINYQTGAITGLYFQDIIPSGNSIQIQYDPVVPTIPLSILFFQNQFTLRPVPDQGYTIELVAYRQPTQALLGTAANAGTPELSEWWELLAFGMAKKIFQDRLDTDGVQLMDKFLSDAYDLAYTRTYAQLGKQRVGTIYADQLAGDYGNGGWGFSSGSM